MAHVRSLWETEVLIRVVDVLAASGINQLYPSLSHSIIGKHETLTNINSDLHMSICTETEETTV